MYFTNKDLQVRENLSQSEIELISWIELYYDIKMSKFWLCEPADLDETSPELYFINLPKRNNHYYIMHNQKFHKGVEIRILLKVEDYYFTDVAEEGELYQLQLIILKCRLKYAVKKGPNCKLNVHRKLSVFNKFLLDHNYHQKVVRSLDRKVAFII